MARSRTHAFALPAALLLGLYLVVLLAPLALAWAQGLPARHWRDELSSALALLAFSGVLVEFLLSGRFRTISGQIGIDATMRVHQLMARAFTVFILLHPFLYVTPFMNRPLPWDETARYTLGLTPTTFLTGAIAWIALMVMVVFAIFREQRSGSYEGWRAAHGFAAVVVAGFGAHHTLEAGRYSAHPWLWWFWILLLAVAAATLIWVYLVKPLLQLRQPFAVRSVEPLGQRIWELSIAPEQRPLDFAAGQFVWLNVGHSPFSLAENPFSIASAPADGDHLAFVIKEAGDFTSRIGGVQPGTRCYLDGPHGHLTIPGSEVPGIALIAGGVGIAPVLSILRQLHHERDERPIVLLYGNRVREQIVYADELHDMQNDLNLQVENALAEPPPDWHGHRGVIDADLLRTILDRPDAKAWRYIICGPQPMIEGVEKTLLSFGVSSGNVISEQFYYD
ncbi:ferredoxin reductase family protein [Dichotomicrobium thermohalophilum]|uniref:Putative ferric reductase n=1 Tax=Dichotomicrobium thermohalophilum TaxID=933063 RepID=A0A397Q692_9HYPH|nr:ferredoxin reductase family protein [Dichotomicrobium thermohalophilum]RIA55057.1 putative ferric reductase [Dichotomicrobium thermohalophilum]